MLNNTHNNFLNAISKCFAIFHLDNMDINIFIRGTLFFSKIIDKIDQSEFDGFEYINPLLMSQEDCV